MVRAYSSLGRFRGVLGLADELGDIGGRQDQRAAPGLGRAEGVLRASPLDSLSLATKRVTETGQLALVAEDRGPQAGRRPQVIGPRLGEHGGDMPQLHGRRVIEFLGGHSQLDDRIEHFGRFTPAPPPLRRSSSCSHRSADRWAQEGQIEIFVFQHNAGRHFAPWAAAS